MYIYIYLYICLHTCLRIHYVIWSASRRREDRNQSAMSGSGTFKKASNAPARGAGRDGIFLISRDGDRPGWSKTSMVEKQSIYSGKEHGFLVMFSDLFLQPTQSKHI